MSLFIDNTRRSTKELLADLATCRQFRHLSEGDRLGAIKETFLTMAELWMGREAIKHPNPSNPCTGCGQPRSKWSYGPGLCHKCYAAKGLEERDLWVEDVFEFAVSLHGIKCDSCGDIHHARIDAEKRFLAKQILENMVGIVRPVLCQGCAQDFKSFCSRNYGQASWRTAPPRYLERMALAWFAQKVKVLADMPPRKKALTEVMCPK